MDDNQRHAGFISALTTEHFALQSAAAATTSEASSRTSIYLLSLSSSLVAIGFASQSPTAFAPLVATVLPAMVVLGILTLIRLVDISSEYRRCLIGIAHIRSYYRTLGPEAAEHFSPARGRWPEPGAPDPSLQLGAPIAYLTTSSTPIAMINSVVAGASIALLVPAVAGSDHVGIAVGIGVAGAVAKMVAFLLYQRWRFGLFDRVAPS